MNSGKVAAPQALMTRKEKTTSRKKHPGGRPPVGEEPRSVTLAPIRVSAAEKALVETLADEHGLTVSEWLRQRGTTTGAAK